MTYLLRKFILKHFGLPDGGFEALASAVDLMIARHGDDLQGMSDYDLAEIYDEALAKL